MTLAAHAYHRSVSFRNIPGFPLILLSTLLMCLALIIYPLVVGLMKTSDSKVSNLYMEYVIAASILDVFILAGLLSTMVVLEVYIQKRFRKIYGKEIPLEEEKAPIRLLSDQNSTGETTAIEQQIPREKETFRFGKYLFSRGLFVGKIPGHTGHPTVHYYHLDTGKFSTYGYGSRWWQMFAGTSRFSSEKIEWSCKPKPLRLIDWKIALIVPVVLIVFLGALIGVSIWFKLAPVFTVFVGLIAIVVMFLSLHSVVKSFTMNYIVTSRRVAVVYRTPLLGYQMDYLYYSDIEEMNWNSTCSSMTVKLIQELEDSINRRYSFRTQQEIPATFHECFHALNIDSACALEDIISKKIPIASTV